MSGRVLIELRASTPLDPSTCMRRFELTLAISARETLRFTFDTDRDDDWVRVPQGNRCAVIYNMRGDRRVALLFVVDRTSGERFVLAKPGQQSRGLVRVAGALAGVVVGVVALSSALPFIAAVGIAGVVGFGTTKGLGYAMKPRHALAEGERDTLSARQGQYCSVKVGRWLPRQTAG